MNSYIKKLFTHVGIMCILFFVGHTVHAQSALLFTVSPARQQVIANPGEEFSLGVKFYNQGQEAVTGGIKVADFIVEDEKGTPTLVEDTKKALSKYSASAWITLPFSQMTIAGYDKNIIQAQVKIPADARPGGRYAAIYFEPEKAAQPQGEAGASITPRIVSLIYIRVSGPIVESALISDLFAQSFYEYGPVEVSAKVMNKGDYHIRPKGSFTLFNTFGGKEDQTKLLESNIFPESQRAYKATVGQKWMVGNYKIALNVQYGSREQFLTRTISVLIFPWRVITIILLSIIIFFILGSYFYRKIRKRDSALSHELNKEKSEIEKLKKELGKRS